MSDIILAVPPESSISIVPPLGLGYLASSLRKKGFEVNLLDFAKQGLTVRSAAEKIIKEKPRFLGISILTYNYNKTKDLIRSVKKAAPEIMIIIGGAHVCALAEFSVHDSGADFAIAGEAEEAIFKLIKAYDSGSQEDFKNIEGLTYREGGRVRVNPGSNIVEDLDSLPFPAWDLIAPQSYRDSPGYFFSRGNSAPIITSRGCPHQCSFCTSRVVHGEKIRYRGHKNVVDEIEMLIKDFGISEFNFCDDSFAENKSLAIAVCDEINRRRLKIHWKTPVGIRLGNIDEEILKVMKSSGCYELGFGIESYNEQVLKISRKPLDKRMISDKIKLVKSLGIETMGFFILGLPGDTEEGIRATIDFARHSALDLLFFSCAVPFPGTGMFEKIFSKKDLYKIGWNKFTFSNQFDTSQIPHRRLKSLFRKAFFHSYAKPVRLAYLVRIFLKLNLPSFFRILKYVFYYVIK